MRICSIAVALTLATLVSSVVFAEDSIRDGASISRVNKSIHLADDSRAGELETVNGSISVGDHAVIESAESVNGAIRVGEDVQAESLEAVNGGIRIGARSRVRDSAETVNGAISLGADAEVLGNVETVNGDLMLAERAHVGGKLITHNGDITLREDARVDAGILIKKSRTSWFGGNQRKPVVSIGANAQVNGDLVFEREVELNVHDSARIGKVVGATVTRFGGAPKVER